ncbi:MAG: hypothetical protein IJJ69_14015 [Oscillospiraceae bacterium]|nr:hypothetical protein [Oscillospiraceae bacterium]
MGKYTGCQCIICQKIFEDNDEIVVCPDCGTPYHRSCYQSAGHCINEPLHAVGGSWQSVQNEHRRKLGGIECPHCGYVNLPDAKKCTACDLPLNQQATDENFEPPEEEQELIFHAPDGQQYYFQASDPCCGMSPDTDIEGERLGDVASFVKTNTLYYIPLFRRFKETDRKLSFNLPCILFPYFYFANRKMWAMALLSGLVWLICSLPDGFLNLLTYFKDADSLETLRVSGANMQMIQIITDFLTAHQQLLEDLQLPLFCAGMAFRIGLCLFGNYLYFQFVLKSVRKIRQTAPTPSLKKALLSAEGGTNFWNVLGCLGIYIGLATAVYLGLEFVFA